MTWSPTFEELDRFLDGRATYRVACPACGPSRRTAKKAKRRVLKLWHPKLDLISYACAHCGIGGYAIREGVTKPNAQQYERLRAEAAANCEEQVKRQREKACWLWRTARTAAGTTAERYLRSRGICFVPNTVRFLAPRKPGQHSAMICPYGLPNESEPGILKITEPAIFAVHLTFLKSDGSDKAVVEDDESDKITVGSPCGRPLVLAPMNDLLGLVITEGIEDALSVHQETGLGAWAAGSSSFMPALAEFVPENADCITVIADDDDAGRRGARDLTRRLNHRGLHVELLEAAHKVAAA
jgi:hypothetical protein